MSPKSGTPDESAFEDLLRLMGTLPIAVVVLNRDHIHFLNQSATNQLGIPPQVVPISTDLLSNRLGKAGLHTLLEHVTGLLEGSTTRSTLALDADDAGVKVYLNAKLNPVTWAGQNQVLLTFESAQEDAERLTRENVRLQNAYEAQHRTLQATRDRLAQLANQDSLTDALNREAFVRHLEVESDRLKRYPGRLSLVLLEVDGMREIFKAHGQARGDTLLKGLVQAVRLRIREVDTLARWEGAQFIILVPETDRLGAWTLAERLRQDAEANTGQSPVSYHLSLGVAEWKTSEDCEALVAKTEAVLEDAREAGGNRVDLAA